MMEGRMEELADETIKSQCEAKIILDLTPPTTTDTQENRLAPSNGYDNKIYEHSSTRRLVNVDS